MWNFPAAAFFAYIPLMLLLPAACDRRDFLRRFAAFFLPYYITQLAFLLTVYKLVPLPHILGLTVMLLTAVFLALWESLLMLAAVYPFTYLKNGSFADVFTLALLISGGEWLQQKIFVLAFPWSAAWLSVTGSPLYMQTANLFGAGFVSFIILVSNGLLARTFFKKGRILSVCALFVIQSFALIYGSFSLDKCERLSTAGEQIKVLCAQDNIEGIKKSELTPLEAAQSYEKILSDCWENGVTLALLPETAVPGDYDETAEEFMLSQSFAESHSCTLVTGCFIEDYNAVYAISPDGEISLPYCKQVLVPFGERNPIDLLMGRQVLCPCKEEDKIQPIETSGMTIAASICIESIFPSLTRAEVNSGGQLITVSTNDSWFGGSFARSQHFRHSIMRAAENSRWLLRAGNCGISAVVSPTGEVTAVKTDSEKGAVVGEISLISERSLYTRIGDIFILLPAGLAAAGYVQRFSEKRRALKR